MNDALKNMNWAGCIILLLTLGMFSCAAHKPFELFDDKTVIKISTVAVINGNNSEATKRLAAELTKALTERSSFKVWSQAKVLSVVKPVILREAQPENPEKPIWLGKAQKTRVDAMQARLKVRYLFVVWTAFSRTDKSADYRVSMNANVVEYPKGQVIGYSRMFGSSKSTKGTDVDRMLKASAAKMADKFIKAANAAKPAKESTAHSSSGDLEGSGL